MHIWQTINALLQGNMNNFDKIFEDNANPTLQKVLNEESIITEFKNCNSKLMNYMKLDQYEQLVKYIIEMPQDDQDRDRAFKFPYVACELLTAEIKQVYDMFLHYEPKDDDKKDSDNDYDFEMDEKNKYMNNQSDDDSDQPSRISITGKNDHKQIISQMGQDEKQQKMLKIQEFMLSNSPEGIYNMVKELEAKLEETRNKLRKQEHKNNRIEEQLEKKVSLIKNLREENSDLKQDSKEAQREKREMLKKLKKAQKQGNAFQGEDDQENEDEEEEEIFDSETQEKRGHYLLSFLFSFLQTKEKVNITLAGYFSKVLTSLISKREKDVVQYVYSKPAILKSLSRQNQARSISIILYKLLSFESKLENQKEHIEERIEILKLMTKIISDPKTEEEERANCTFVVGETICKWQQMVAGQQIMNFILNDLSKEWLKGLDSTENQVVYQNCVLLNILLNQVKNWKEQKQEEDADMSELNDTNINDTILISNIKDKIKATLDLLEENPKGSIRTQYQRNLQPLGQTKIKLISFIQVLINQDNTEFDCELASNDVFGKLLVLFQQYEWNNVLHYLVTEIIIRTLDKQNVTLMRNLFEEAKLCQFLKQCTENLYSEDNPKSNKKAFRKGYLGHVYKIGSVIQKIMDNDEQFKDNYIKKNSSDWDAFIKQFYKSQRDKNEKELGGNNNKSDDNEIESDQDKLLYNDQDIQSKYTHFMSESGSEEEDHNQNQGEQNSPSQDHEWEKQWQTNQVNADEADEQNNDFEAFDKDIDINNNVAQDMQNQMEIENQEENQEQDQNEDQDEDQENEEDNEEEEEEDYEEKEEGEQKQQLNQEQVIGQQQQLQQEQEYVKQQEQQQTQVEPTEGQNIQEDNLQNTQVQQDNQEAKKKDSGDQEEDQSCEEEDDQQNVVQGQQQEEDEEEDEEEEEKEVDSEVIQKTKDNQEEQKEEVQTEGKNEQQTENSQ